MLLCSLVKDAVGHSHGPRDGAQDPDKSTKTKCTKQTPPTFHGQKSGIPPHNFVLEVHRGGVDMSLWARGCSPHGARSRDVKCCGQEQNTLTIHRDSAWHRFSRKFNLVMLQTCDTCDHVVRWSCRRRSVHIQSRSQQKSSTSISCTNSPSCFGDAQDHKRKIRMEISNKNIWREHKPQQSVRAFHTFSLTWL